MLSGCLFPILGGQGGEQVPTLFIGSDCLGQKGIPLGGGSIELGLELQEFIRSCGIGAPQFLQPFLRRSQPPGVARLAPVQFGAHLGLVKAEQSVADGQEGFTSRNGTVLPMY